MNKNKEDIIYRTCYLEIRCDNHTVHNLTILDKKQIDEIKALKKGTLTFNEAYLQYFIKNTFDGANDIITLRDFYNDNKVRNLILSKSNLKEIYIINHGYVNEKVSSVTYFLKEIDAIKNNLTENNN